MIKILLKDSQKGTKTIEVKNLIDFYNMKELFYSNSDLSDMDNEDYTYTIENNYSIEGKYCKWEHVEFINSKNLYKEIKKKLLLDDNIRDVSYSSPRKEIHIKVNTGKKFLCVEDVFANFYNPVTGIKIHNIYFKIKGYSNFNTTIYTVVLKEEL